MKDNWGEVCELMEDADKPDAKNLDSWSYYKNINPEEEPFDIFHELKGYYSEAHKGNHYHQLLKRGENTLNLRLARIAMRVAVKCGKEEKYLFDMGEFLNQYFKLLLTPGLHSDTFIGKPSLSLMF